MTSNITRGKNANSINRFSPTKSLSPSPRIFEYFTFTKNIHLTQYHVILKILFYHQILKVYAICLERACICMIWSISVLMRKFFENGWDDIICLPTLHEVQSSPFILNLGFPPPHLATYQSPKLTYPPFRKGRILCNMRIIPLMSAI